MNPQYWSWILTAVGVFGLWLAGRKDRRGWMVGIGAQGLWIAYATATHQWGFYVSSLAYGWVYAKNARAWKVPVASSATDWVDPVGWDEHHQRVHDVGLQTDGRLMHYPTCWCRQFVPAALSVGGDEMGFVKHGTGDVLPEPEDKKTAASKEWTEDDQQELTDENAKSDKE